MTQASLAPLGADELVGGMTDALLAVDDRWRLRFVNEAAERMLQAPRSPALGADLWSRFPCLVGTPFEEGCRQALRERRPVTATAFAPHVEAWLTMQAMPLRNGLSVHFHDVTAVKAAEARPERVTGTPDMLHRIADAVATGTPAATLLQLVCDETAGLTGAEGCWAVRFTTTGSLVVGASASQEARLAVGDDLPFLPGGQLDDIQRSGAPTCGTPQGRLAGWGLETSAAVPLRVHGRLWGALGVGWVDARAEAAAGLGGLTDVAGLVGLALGALEPRTPATREEPADAASAATDLWRSSVDALPGHVAVLDEHGAVLAVNAAWHRCAEAAPEARPGPGQDLLARLADSPAAHDRQLALELRELLDEEREHVDAEYPLTLDGRERWFAVRAHRFGADGPRRVVTHHEDITAHRGAREELRPEALGLGTVPAAVVATDADGAVTQWSAGAERLFGYTSEEAVGRPVEALLPSEGPAPGRPPRPRPPRTARGRASCASATRPGASAPSTCRRRRSRARTDGPREASRCPSTSAGATSTSATSRPRATTCSR